MSIHQLKVRGVILLVIALAPTLPLRAQDAGGESKINSNLAMVLNMPVSSTAQVAGTGWGATGGIGYNIS